MAEEEQIRKPTKEELKGTLERHKQWLESQGREGEQANLPEATLWLANLQGATLRHAKLQKADLSNVRGWQAIGRLDSANVYKVRNAPEGFMEWAVKKGAVCIADEKEWNRFRLKVDHTTEELRAAQKDCFPDKEQGEGGN